MAGKYIEDPLWRALHETPIIDNHAHPLLKPSSLDKYPLLTIAAEAHGPALASSRQSLAHIRAVKQLSGVLGCEQTWEAVESSIKKRRGNDYEAWIKRCLEGIECVLVDDGLDADADVHAYDYFDGFCRGQSKRIVRIEPLAATLIEKYCVRDDDPSEALVGVLREFVALVEQAIRDPAVVGFKSVICYRTGLAIPRHPDSQLVQTAFAEIHRQRRTSEAGPFTRLDHAGLNEYFVHVLAKTISQNGSDEGDKAAMKPIQFHTGLGDNDITLTKSSPAHMQDFIEAYPSVPMVLLHSGYPFVREMGYLAAMYSNVYADIGEVFPFLSRDGQEGVVRQILELCPWSKILWSTDGHWFPETYLLAVVQVREVLFSILSEYVRKGDISMAQAVQLVEDIFFRNSNKLYHLGMQLDALPRTSFQESVQQPEAGETPGAVLSRLVGCKDEPKLLRIYWTDMTGLERMRAVPFRRLLSMAQTGDEISFGVAKAALGVIQCDMMAQGVSASGEYRLQPDFGTLRAGPRDGHLYVRGDFKEQDGSAVAICPRSTLKRVLNRGREQGLDFMLGFEIELVLMRRTGTDASKFEPLVTDGHAWCVANAMDHEAATSVVEEAVSQLDEVGIYVEMIHAESATGQYEVVLPRRPALDAVDTLLYVRAVLSACASAKGYKMTLHPKPFAGAPGTAAHVHMSICSPGGNEKSTYEPFYAGILHHLVSACALTYATRASYLRAVDGFWAGGTWVAWGTQNRETPLRKVQDGHWEVKCVDGTANMYLAVAGLIGAGLVGVAGDENTYSLSRWGDCGDEAPGDMTEQRRNELGIETKLPESLADALGSVREDEELVDVMGFEVLHRYMHVKKAEEAFVEEMGEEERKTWMMERY